MASDNIEGLIDTINDCIEQKIERTVKEIIKRNTDRINTIAVTPNALGWCPLQTAVLNAKGNLKIIELFVNSGLDVNCSINQQGATMLHMSVVQQDYKLTKYLLKTAHIKVNVQNNNGETALFLATLLCKTFNPKSTMQLLLKMGAKATAQNKKGQTALHAAVDPLTCDKLTKVRELLENGANPNIADADGKTVLHRIMANYAPETIEVAQILLKSGVNISARDRSGLTAFDYMMMNKGKQYELMDTLIDSGIKLPKIARHVSQPLITEFLQSSPLMRRNRFKDNRRSRSMAPLSMPASDLARLQKLAKQGGKKSQEKQRSQSCFALDDHTSQDICDSLPTTSSQYEHNACAITPREDHSDSSAAYDSTEGEDTKNMEPLSLAVDNAADNSLELISAKYSDELTKTDKTSKPSFKYKTVGRKNKDKPSMNQITSESEEDSDHEEVEHSRFSAMWKLCESYDLRTQRHVLWEELGDADNHEATDSDENETDDSDADEHSAAEYSENEHKMESGYSTSDDEDCSDDENNNDESSELSHSVLNEFYNREKDMSLHRKRANSGIFEIERLRRQESVKNPSDSKIFKILNELKTDGECVAALKELLKNKGGDCVGWKNKAGETPLHCAALRGFAETCKLLLSQHCEKDQVCVQDVSENTPLHRAVQYRHKDMVNILLSHIKMENGAQICNAKGETAMHIAVKTGNKSNVQALYPHFRNITIDKTEHYIRLALKFKDNKLARKLVKYLTYGAENSKNVLFITAAANNNVDVVKFLLDMVAAGEKIDINTADNYKFTALHFAVQNNNEGLVTSLLEKGAKVNVRSENDETPFMLAIDNGNSNLAKLLKSCGAKHKCMDRTGRTCLHRIVARSKGLENMNMIIWLLGLGLKLDQPDNLGYKPSQLTDSDSLKSILMQYVRKPYHMHHTF